MDQRYAPPYSNVCVCVCVCVCRVCVQMCKNVWARAHLAPRTLGSLALAERSRTLLLEPGAGGRFVQPKCVLRPMAALCHADGLLDDREVLKQRVDLLRDALSRVILGDQTDQDEEHSRASVDRLRRGAEARADRLLVIVLRCRKVRNSKRLALWAKRSKWRGAAVGNGGSMKL